MINRAWRIMNMESNNVMLEELTEEELFEHTQRLYKEFNNIQKDIESLQQGLHQEYLTKLKNRIESLKEQKESFGEIISLTNNKAEKTDYISQESSSLKEKCERLNQLFEKAKKKIDGFSVGQQKTEYLNQRTSDQLQDINNFVLNIQEISEEINLLALNATIEAVHAGEYGRGFTVIAEEVRKLADEAKNAADEAKEMVEGINISFKEVSKGVDNSGYYVRETSKKTLEILEILTPVLKSISYMVEQMPQLIAICEENIFEINKIYDLLEKAVGEMEDFNEKVEKFNIFSESNLVLEDLKLEESTRKELLEHAEKLNRELEKARKEFSTFQENSHQSEYIKSEHIKMDANFDSLKSLAKLLNEVDISSSKITENVDIISQEISSIREMNEKLNQLLEQTKESVNGIYEGQQETVLFKQNTDSKLKEIDISSFVDNVQNISKQTNLLALNATIEAAHAEGYGQGFTVVAQEVRKLSDKSKEATKEAKEKSEGVNSGLRKVFKGLEIAGNIIKNMYNSFDETHKELGSITESIDNLESEIKKIADLSNQQIDLFNGHEASLKNLLDSELKQIIKKN